MVLKESRSASRSGSLAMVTLMVAGPDAETPVQQIGRPCKWNIMRRLPMSHTIGPSAPSHRVPRTTPYLASGMTKRSAGNGVPSTVRGASRMTTTQVTRSRLATMAVRRGRW